VGVVLFLTNSSRSRVEVVSVLELLLQRSDDECRGLGR
jgi:hypothetical protein